MAAFKPSISYNVGSYYESKTYNTYQQLKADLRRVFATHTPGIIHVSRSRRGAWGEWFEHWQLVNGKPIKTKEGWM